MNDLIQSEINLLKERLARVDAESALLRAEQALDAERKRSRGLTAELGAAAAEMRALRDKGDLIAAIYASTSWRLTGPLRGASSVYRNLAGAIESHVPARLLRGFRGRGLHAGRDTAMPGHSRVTSPGSSKEAELDVLFLIGCWEGESKRYRVHNVAEGLIELGYVVDVMDYGRAVEVMQRGLRPKTAVFFRAPFDVATGIVQVLEYFRAHEVKTVFDVDDYVFEPALVASIAGVAHLSPAEQKQYDKGVRAYRALMLSTDMVTVSTAYLADRVRELGRDVSVVPNSLNLAQKERADITLATTKPRSQEVRICYFSGSRTHDRDFAQCAEALRTVMLAHPEIILRIGGFLDLSAEWSPFEGRIERIGFLPHLDMLDSMAECDINLAPLEEGNPFCEGKSELKFFEAALVEVPTVASRTNPFANAIEDGRSGFLASDKEEWRRKLELLATDATLRKQMGVIARDAALSTFDYKIAAQKAAVAYGLEDDIGPSSSVRHPEGLKIGWIIPGLIIGGGGHRNILRAAYHLERFGHDVRLYFTGTNQSARELKRAVRRHFYPFEGPISLFNGHADHEDVMLATHWSTVAPAESVAGQVSHIFYFVQDFEPAFYPMGSEYILAENTYRKSLYAITSGPWCERLLRVSYGMEADHFQFPIDRETYSARPERMRERRILFFAKPDMPRRCFEIGVMALRELHHRRPEYKIFLFGSNAVDHQDLGFPATVQGVLPTIGDLAELYATSEIGIVFSTTNPSLVPYEMMACGLPVVDLKRPGNEVNYADRSDIAFLADPDPVRMAREIDALLDDSEELAARSARGLDFAATFPTEDEMAQRVEALILDRVRGAAETAMAQ